MATVETNPNLGAQIVADAKEYVLYSWSVQNQISPIPVAGAEGRHFWDYDGKRYLDFASQLVNVSIGHQHPKIIAAIKEQADKLCTIGPPMANESRSHLGRLLAEVTPGDRSGLRSARHPGRPRRGDGRLRPVGQVVRLRPLERRPRHPHGCKGDQFGLRAARRDDRPRRDRRSGARPLLPRWSHVCRPPT